MAQHLPETASKISRAILDRLNSAGIETSALDFQQLQDRKVGALARPAINISINQGTFKKITMTTYKCSIIVTLYLMVAELRGEDARRFMVLNLIEAINQTLLLEKLGLELQDPLIPQSFENVTDAEFSGAGFLIYQLKYSCSYNTTKIPDDEDQDLGILKRIMLNYYLQEPDDGVRDARGEINLTGIWGGDAFSVYKREPIYGGHAGSRFSHDVFYGGIASSTY